MTATSHTFDVFSFRELVFGDTANACGAKVCFALFNALETAELFISGFPPFGNESFVGIALLDKPVEQLFVDDLVLVVGIENDPVLLMMNAGYRPC